LSTDPAAAREVVLADKPLISEETDLLEPSLLDELVCHIASLASVYHKPPSAFVEGRGLGSSRRALPTRSGSQDILESSPSHGERSGVIPTQESLIGDLLTMDLGGPPVASSVPAAPFASSGLDLLSGGLDGLLSDSPSVPPQQAAATAVPSVGLLGDIFGLAPSASASYIAPKQVSTVTICIGDQTCHFIRFDLILQMWLPAARGKGLEITGTFSRRNGQIQMEMTMTNRAMQPMIQFAVQLNKNSFGLVPAAPLHVVSPLAPNQSYEAVLLLNPTGPVQRMEPLTNLQVAIKNNIDVFYFAVVMPMNVFFAEDGQMDKRVFLSTWKDIPAANEVQYTINNVNLSADAVSSKMQQNNVFTIAKRNVEGQDMLYQSLKLVNGIWILSELKMQPGNPTLILAVKTRAPDVSTGVNTAFDAILHS
jgi:AP-1 complex subunit beta-1